MDTVSCIKCFLPCRVYFCIDFRGDAWYDDADKAREVMCLMKKSTKPSCGARIWFALSMLLVVASAGMGVWAIFHDSMTEGTALCVIGIMLFFGLLEIHAMDKTAVSYDPSYINTKLLALRDCEVCVGKDSVPDAADVIFSESGIAVGSLSDEELEYTGSWDDVRMFSKDRKHGGLSVGFDDGAILSVCSVRPILMAAAVQILCEHGVNEILDMDA